jgi:hypothetical protein
LQWDEVLRRTRRQRAGSANLGAFVDTNVPVRHLTGDPPEMAAHATALLAGGDRLLPGI